MEPQLASTKVLIVDDSMIVRRAIRKAVTAAGVHDDGIREAPNGEEAIGALDDEPVDVVFLDINMPVMGGEEFMEAMDAAGRADDQFIIIVSTEVNAKRLLKMATLGARGRLKKPFEPERLQKLIADAVREKSAS